MVDCWAHDPVIAKWMKQNNFTDVYQAFYYFSKRLGTIVQPPSVTAQGRVQAPMGPRDPSLPPYVNRTMVVWQDVFDDNYCKLAHPEMVIEVFRDKGSVRSAVSSGYRAIYALPYYLDQQVWCGQRDVRLRFVTQLTC